MNLIVFKNAWMLFTPQNDLASYASYIMLEKIEPNEIKWKKARSFRLSSRICVSAFMSLLEGLETTLPLKHEHNWQLSLKLEIEFKDLLSLYKVVHLALLCLDRQKGSQDKITAATRTSSRKGLNIYEFQYFPSTFSFHFLILIFVSIEIFLPFFRVNEKLFHKAEISPHRKLAKNETTVSRDFSTLFYYKSK